MHEDRTLFVVDNDPGAREGVETLARAMRVPCEPYASGREFLDHFDPERPGCVVLAMRILDISGPQIQRRLLAEGVPTPVIFVTSHASIPMVVRVMQDGALHLLEKPFEQEELFEIIQTGFAVDRERRRQRRHQERLQARLAALSSPEKEVLELLARGASSRQISQQQEVTVRAVELRRNRVMRKLGASSLAELVQIVLTCQGQDGRLHEGLLVDTLGQPLDVQPKPALFSP